MRRAKWVMLAGILSVLAAGASAQGPQRMGPGHDAEGDMPRRTMPAERSERMPPAVQAPRERGPHRMSAEDRRQLRRDVHQAGQDIYPERMPGGRRGEMRRQ
ncbi:MAG: hypothetical protein Q8J99_06570 [Sulfuritalea sp.]|nr:hypothetical protein [Sulfuritalea sp.]